MLSCWGVTWLARPFFSKDLTRNPFFARHVVNLICFTLDDFSNKGVGVKVFCFNLGGNWYKLLEPRKNDGTMKLVHNTWKANNDFFLFLKTFFDLESCSLDYAECKSLYANESQVTSCVNRSMEFTCQGKSILSKVENP